ncbi:hypothetical protein PoB_002012400 [Plakobranchus ocellatus]|uniref:Uncharacterized protein n=1 Tax=Plakobranchus ocellatus TaxID=259542 RepID=A0AAV3ZGV7_9GAST|nr:hypothetical protein PoB_002012400 [Plakobranchus ocellatus]
MTTTIGVDSNERESELSVGSYIECQIGTSFYPTGHQSDGLPAGIKLSHRIQRTAVAAVLSLNKGNVTEEETGRTCQGQRQTAITKTTG